MVAAKLPACAKQTHINESGGLQGIVCSRREVKSRSNVIESFNTKKSIRAQKLDFVSACSFEHFNVLLERRDQDVKRKRGRFVCSRVHCGHARSGGDWPFAHRVGALSWSCTHTAERVLETRYSWHSQLNISDLVVSP